MKEQETITKMVMKDKLKNAWNKVRKEQTEEQRAWRKLRRKLQNRQSTDDRTGEGERTEGGTNATNGMNEMDTSRSDIDVITAISETNTQHPRSRIGRETIEEPVPHVDRDTDTNTTQNTTLNTTPTNEPATETESRGTTTLITTRMKATETKSRGM